MSKTRHNFPRRTAARVVSLARRTTARCGQHRRGEQPLGGALRSAAQEKSTFAGAKSGKGTAEATVAHGGKGDMARGGRRCQGWGTRQTRSRGPTRQANGDRAREERTTVSAGARGTLGAEGDGESRHPRGTGARPEAWRQSGGPATGRKREWKGERRGRRRASRRRPVGEAREP